MTHYTKRQIMEAGGKAGIEFGKLEAMFKVLDSPKHIELCRICVHHSSDYDHIHDYCTKGFDIDKGNYCNSRNFTKRK